MYQNILVPLDGSENAKQALAEAIKLAKNFNAQITLLTVVNEGTLFMTAGSVPNHYANELTHRAEMIEEEGKAAVKAAGLSVRTTILKGLPKNVITNFSADHDVDLIVIGKSGVDAFDRLLIGSTTACVVRNAKVKVLVVNADSD